MSRCRRAFAWSAACLAAMLCLGAAAQVPTKTFRIGLLVLNTSHVEEPVIALLRDKGFVGGQNTVIELRRAEGRPERLPELAGELVRLKVDVLVAFTNAPAFAARSATRTIPIVVWGAHDAVGTGLVADLARPGGNVTGVESLAPALDAKRVQFLRELLPSMNRLAVLNNPSDHGAGAHLRVTREAAGRYGVSLLPIDVAARSDVDRAVAAISEQRPDAVLTFTDPLTNFAFDRVAEEAHRHRLPTMCEFREFVQRGCLLSYGATLAEFNDRVARFVELILKGAHPADLPMEQPTRLELVLNRKTARQIGIVFPHAILQRADQVVD